MKLLYTLFFSLLAAFMFAQNATMNGLITDEGGEPLYNATVVFDASKGLAGTTDFDGLYAVDVPAGTYVVEVKYLGMQDYTFEITLSENEVITRDIVLSVNEKVITEVEVSATKRGLSVEREVVTIESISPDLLLNNNITNGADAVDKVVGVTLLDGQASIRGGSGYAYGVGSRVILVIDDIPLLSPERSEVLWDFIPMENLKSLDVVKGASSVQFGSAALNGIVNVRTLWPVKEKETEITVFSTMYDNPPIAEGKWWEYSSQQYRQDPHEMGFTAVHRRKLNDEMDLVVNGTMNSAQTHIESQSLSKIRSNIKFRYKPKNVAGLTTGINTNIFYRNKDVFFLWEGFGEGSYQGRSFTDKYIRSTFDPYVKWVFNDNNRIGLFNRVYYDNRLGSDYYAVSIYNDFQYQRSFSNAAKSEAKNTINGSLLSGVVNTQNIIKASSFDDFSVDGDGLFHLNNLGVYTQADMTINNLSLAAGARFDFITLDTATKASKPVFNAGASYKIGKSNFVRASFGQSFRLPSIAERYVLEEIADFGMPVFAGPNPDIKPEEGFSIELGYKRTIGRDRWQGYVDAVVFYQDYKDMVEFTFSASNINPINGDTYWGFTSQNVANAKIFGWEFSSSLTGKIGRFPVSMQGGYTYNYPANAEEDTTLNSLGKVFVNSFKAFAISDEEHASYNTVPTDDNILHGMLRYRFRHTFKLDISMDVDKFTFGTNMRYYSFMDKVDLVFGLAIPDIQQYRNTLNNNGEFVVDVRSFYRFNEKVKVGFLIRNLFNNDYQLRPAKPDAPRTFTLQGNFKF